MQSIWTFCQTGHYNFNGWDNPNRNWDRYRDRRDMALGHEKRPTASISIPIAIWIPKKENPYKTDALDAHSSRQ